MTMRIELLAATLYAANIVAWLHAGTTLLAR